MSYDFVAASTQYFSTPWPVGQNEPFFISCWFNPDASATQDIVSLSDDSGFFTDYWTLRQVSTTLRAVSQLSAGSTAFAETGVGVTVSTWQHACAVFASDADRRIYLDLTNTGTDTTSITVTGSNIDVLSIGALKQTIALNPFDGYLAELIIARGVPSHAEIAQLSAGFGTGFNPRLSFSNELLGYWPLLKDHNDHSGYGRHLTPTSTPARSDTHPKIQHLEDDPDLSWMKDHIPARVRAADEALRAS